MKNRIYYFLSVFLLSVPLLVQAGKSLDQEESKHPEVSKEALDHFSNYSFNLMWINKEFDRHQKYIVPEATKDHPESPLNQLKNWISVLGKEKSIQLWYDSQFVSSSALENTRTFLLEDNSKGASLQPIVFRDVRELQEVQEHPDVFSQNMPVYFRVDLLRVIAAYRSLIHNENEYFVYADLDVMPLSEREIFDKKTKQKLKDFGIVMARDYMFNFENSFQITSKNDLLLKAMKTVLIDVSIEQGIKREGYADLAQAVFTNYPTMFHYFYHLQGWGRLVSNSSLNLEVLSVDQWAFYMKHRSFRFEPKEKVIPTKDCFGLCDGAIEKKDRIVFPTRKINRPYTRHGLGGSPKKSESHISVSKYDARLHESLSHSESFDNTFLYLAVKNDYLDKVEQIKNRLTDEEFYRAFASIANQYNYHQLSPFFLAVQEGKREVLKIVKNRLSNRRDLWKSLVQSIGEYPFFYRCEKDPVEILQLLEEVFAEDQYFFAALAQSINKKGRVGKSFFEESIVRDRFMVIKKIADLFATNEDLLSQFELSEETKKNSYFIKRIKKEMREVLKRFPSIHLEEESS